MSQSGEPVLVQTLVPKPSVERLDVGILVWLARLDLPQQYSALMRPGEHGSATEFLAIVGPDDLGQSSFQAQPIQHARQGIATDGALRHNSDRFMGGVINDGQTFDCASLSGAVEHEVHRPDLVGSVRPDQRLAIRYRHLFALSALHLQTCLSIEPIHTLVIDPPARLPELQVDHARTVTAIALCQQDDLLAQRHIAVRSRLIAIGAGTHAGNT